MIARLVVQSMVAAGLGFGLLTWWLPPAPPAVPTTAAEAPRGLPPREPVARAQPAPVPACEEAAPLQEQLAALQSQAAQVREEAASVAARSDALEGVPQQWPVDVPATYREAEVERAVARAIGAVSGTELLGIDCVEFPCIFRIQGPPGDKHAAIEAWELLSTHFVGGEVRQGSSRVIGETREAMLFDQLLYLVPPEGLSDEAARRLKHRLKTTDF